MDIEGENFCYYMLRIVLDNIAYKEMNSEQEKGD